MLTGPRIALRARVEADVEILHAGLRDDVEGISRADTRAWRPSPPGELSPFVPRAPSDEVADFTVVLQPSGEVLGAALLWSIDLHNRSAHIGISLLSGARGSGIGTEVLEVLCDYGFRVLGLHRLQLETLADNAAMLKAAARAGFQVEGTTRKSAWVLGTYVDDIVLGQLADEWRIRSVVNDRV